MFNKIINVLLAVIILGGCDIVEPPYIANPSENGPVEGVRKVLLEEFTGHQCPNCPDGALIAKSLEEHYGDRLVIVSIHAGFFSLTGPSPFTYDFRSTAGDEINSHFGISYNPLGMVNRQEFDGSHIISPSGWGSAISQIIDQEPQVDISLTTTYSEPSRRIDVTASTTLLQDMQGDYFLSLFLIEDGIIKPQKTNDQSFPGGVNMEYEHNHVLRAAINSTWGEKIISGQAHKGDVINNSGTIILDADWDHTNCSVVGFIYRSTDMEVIQAEKKPLE